MGAASLLLTAGEGEARAPVTLIGTTVLVGEARTRTGPMSTSRDRLEKAKDMPEAGLSFLLQRQ